MTVKEPLGIEAFVRAYSDEDAPACLITLRERTESTASESHPYPDITASNSCFTDAHKEQLMRASSRLEQEKVLRTGEMRWSVTKVAPSDEAVHVSTLVCLGRREKRTIPEGSTHTASRSPRKKDRASQQVPRTKGHGTKSSQAEEYRQRWSGMSVAGTDRIAFLQHLDLILGVDWARTPLGPMSTWSTALLSLLGQCLASPFPVLFAWGPELTQLYNLPYSVNIGQKHPANLGKAYRDAWPEMWDRKYFVRSRLNSPESSPGMSAALILTLANRCPRGKTRYGNIPNSYSETCRYLRALERCTERQGNSCGQ